MHVHAHKSTEKHIFIQRIFCNATQPLHQIKYLSVVETTKINKYKFHLTNTTYNNKNNKYESP